MLLKEYKLWPRKYSFKEGAVFLVIFSIIFLIVSSSYLLSTQFRAEETQQEYIRGNSERINKICSNSTNWKICYAEELAGLDKLTTFPITLRVLSALQEGDDRVHDCHFLAHKITSAEIEADPGSWTAIFSLVNPSDCDNGYLHGVVEGKQRADSSWRLSAKSIPVFCDEIEQEVLRKRKQDTKTDGPCAHVMGHILLVQESGIVDRAIGVCSDLDKTWRRYCYEGVFMENIVRSNLTEHGLSVPTVTIEEVAEDLEKICKGYAEDIAIVCWQELSHSYIGLVHKDLPKLYGLCARAEDEQMTFECYLHSVELIVPYSSLTNDVLQNVCAPFRQEKDRIRECIARTVRYIVRSSSNSLSATRFCQAQEQDVASYCFNYLGKN